MVQPGSLSPFPIVSLAWPPFSTSLLEMDADAVASVPKPYLTPKTVAPPPTRFFPFANVTMPCWENHHYHTTYVPG